MGCSDASASFLFTDDREIRGLNARYRGEDKPTDVLSFAAMDAALPKALRKARSGGPQSRALGDIVISVDTLLRQAKDYGVTPREELLRLLVHGALHLLGYEHEGVARREAERMRRKEATLLKRLAAAPGKQRRL